MVSSQVEVVNPTGIHARPATVFVQGAKKFQSQIRLKNLALKEAAPVNAKSVVMVLSLGVKKGANIEISAEGPDEEEAVSQLAALVAGGLGE